MMHGPINIRFTLRYNLSKECKKVKVKWSCYRSGMAQRVGDGIALLFHDRCTRRGWVVSSTPRPHFTDGKEPVPILQEAGWVPGPVWTGGKSRPHRDSIPDRPARSSVAIPTELPGPRVCIYIYIYINGWKRSYTVAETCHCMLQSIIEKCIVQVRPVFAPESYKLTTTLTCSVKLLRNYTHLMLCSLETSVNFCQTA